MSDTASAAAVTTAPTLPTIDPATPYYFDAVKILGTGNSTGLFGALVALYYFANKGESVLLWVKIMAVPYLIGICLFASAFAALAVYSIDQHNPTVHLRTLETWLKWAIGFGMASFIAWWLGTAAAVKVLWLLW